MKARTVAQVVAAEAGGKTMKDRFQAMQDVFSAAYNRSVQTGVPVKDVVSVKSQFNAYDSVMPAGTPSLVGLAQRAIDAVMANGPTHKGTYYARSYATKGLPKGLTKVKSAVDDHQYYVDPQDRAIKTAAGTKAITRAALPDVQSSLPQTAEAPQARPASFDARFNARPSINVAKPFSPETYASATAPRSSFPSRPNQIAANSFRPSVDVAETPEQIDRLSRAQMPQAMAAQNRFAPTNLGVPSALQSQNVASFTPQGMNINDIATPSGGFTSVDPHAFSSVVDPMDSNLATEAQASADRHLPSNPEPKSYAEVQQDYADRQAAKATRESVATDIASNIGGKIGGFFSSLADQGAVAKAPNTIGTMLAGMDKKYTPAPTYAEAVTPAKAAPAKPEAIYDDPRALAYAEKMQLQPVDAVLPNVPEEIAQPVQQAKPRVQRTVRTVKPTQITVNRPARVERVDPTAGKTLGGVKPGDRFSVGTGLSGINAAIGGARGATAMSRSNPGMSVTSLGPNLGTATYNSQYGTTTFRDPSGKTTGTQYDKPGGFLGALGRTLGFGKGLGSNRSAEGMRGISPGAAGAIGRGEGGLY